MNVSLYIIGTELTNGIIPDKHTQFLSSELSKIDYSIKRSVIVPDDGSIENILRLGAKDSDVILVTGGLGPTSDDMTRNIIADIANVKLVKNQGAWDALYARVGERIHGANEQQAYVPEGFDVIPNNNGTACGFKGTFEYEGNKVLIVSMPGPPAEMQPMFYENVLPMLAKLKGYRDLGRDEYSVFMIAEAKLEDLCNQVKIDGVTWGTRFQAFRISLYIGGSCIEDRKLFIKKLRQLAGDALIVDGNVEAVDLITSVLKEEKKTICCAESCTSGLVAKMLTDKAGSSAWFWGGACTYSLEAKQKILGISKDITDPVTEECAKQMAQGMLKLSNADFAVSVTGYAGPATESDTHAVGTVFFGFASKQFATQVVGLNLFPINRESARKRFAVAALILANLYVKGNNLIDITRNWLYI